MEACQICNSNQTMDVYEVREMMYGIGETFTYCLCKQCNCLQIESIPVSIEKYYQNNYYSFKKNNSFLKKLNTQMAIWRDKGELFGQNFFGTILSKFIPAREEIKFIAYLDGIHKSSKILDIGSGIGTYLKRLHDLGFTNLRGIDPFLQGEKIEFDDVVIYKKFLADFDEGDFDLITLHHTFEHLPDPAETLAAIFTKLKKGGYCAIRTPVIPNQAWKMYKQNWFQIDAPRHFFIHSSESISFLAKQNGFDLDGIIYDSTPKQFYISELYEKGIPLKQQSRMPGKVHSQLARKTALANKLSQGDQAIFILKKPN